MKKQIRWEQTLLDDHEWRGYSREHKVKVYLKKKKKNNYYLYVASFGYSHYFSLYIRDECDFPTLSLVIKVLPYVLSYSYLLT